MNYFDRRKVLKETNTMDLVPLRTRNHEIEEENLVLLVPKFEWKVLLNILPSLRNQYFRVKLDPLGSKVWRSIDGQKTVGDIARQIRSEDRNGELDLTDLEDRLGKYMSMLYERKFISFTQIQEN